MNISLFFKTLLFLLFMEALNDKISVQYETTTTILQSFAIVSILILEGDQFSLEDEVNNCSMVFPLPGIIRERGFESSIFVACLEFKDLLFSTRQQIEQQLQQFKGTINIQWNQTQL